MRIGAALAAMGLAITGMVIATVSNDRDNRSASAPRSPSSIATTGPGDAAWRSALARSDEMVVTGLRYLARNQNADGSFGGNESRDIRVALSSVACLAFLAHGETEYRGTFHTVVEKAIKFLISCSLREGKRKGYFWTNGDTTSRLHGHAYATLALSQAYGMFGVQRKYASTSTQLKEVISDAVSIILRSQSRVGGWHYEPFDVHNDEGSMTVCMIQSLRSARNAGFHVPPTSIAKAIDYIRKSQNTDGSFRYQLNGETASTFELAAAAISTLLYAGEYYDRAVRNGRDFLWDRKFDDFISSPIPQGHPYYGLFYAVQVLWFDYDRDRLRRYYPRIVDWYRRHWDPATGVYRHPSRPHHQEMRYGDVYRTAFATLTMQIPDGFLPVFQR